MNRSLVTNPYPQHSPVPLTYIDIHLLIPAALHTAVRLRSSQQTQNVCQRSNESEETFSQFTECKYGSLNITEINPITVS